MIEPSQLATLRRFRVAELNPAGGFVAWRKSIAGVFDAAGEPADIAAFEGSLTIWSTGRTIISDSSASHIRLLRSTDTSDGLDHFAVMLILSGNLRGLAASKEITAGPKDILLIDLSQAANLLLSAQGGITSYITLWIPRARLMSLISDDHALHGLVLRGITPAASILGASLTSLGSHADQLTVREMDTLTSGVVALAAQAITSALEASALPGVAAPLASLVTIRRFIDRNLMSPDLGTKMIASRFGLSRTSLYRLFEPHGGIAGYIRHQRLNRAYQDLTAPGLANQRIGPIAYRWGFKNVSAFSQLFQKAYGVTPRQARLAGSSGMIGLATSSSEGEAGVLAEWLRQTAKT